MMIRYRIKTIRTYNGECAPLNYEITNLLRNLNNSHNTTTDDINDAYRFCAALLKAKQAQELEVEETK